MAGTVFVNPSSGADDDTTEEVRNLLAAHQIIECAPDDLDDHLRAAVAAAPDFVGIAGGDGTVGAAVQVLVGTGIPLLPIPAGTRNHFARDVGLETIADAAVAAAGGHTRPVDVGEVNGRYFVNNSSIGVYPMIVIRREAHEQRLPKGMANVVAAFEQLRRGHRLSIEVDGTNHRVWLSFIGNGRYGDGLLDLADRESLDEHVLDVRLVSADRPLARLRVVGTLVLGRLARSPLVTRLEATDIVVTVKRRRVEVALDGEVETLESPLRYRSMKGGLVVLVR